MTRQPGPFPWEEDAFAPDAAPDDEREEAHRDESVQEGAIPTEPSAQITEAGVLHDAPVDAGAGETAAATPQAGDRVTDSSYADASRVEDADADTSSRADSPAERSREEMSRGEMSRGEISREEMSRGEKPVPEKPAVERSPAENSRAEDTQSDTPYRRRASDHSPPRDPAAEQSAVVEEPLPTGEGGRPVYRDRATDAPRVSAAAVEAAVPAGITAGGAGTQSQQHRPLVRKEYYAISEVSDLVGLPAHVLRYWESQFSVLNPSKNRSGNRVYQRKEIRLILLVKQLLYDEKYTVEGAKQRLDQLRRGGGLQDATTRALDEQLVQALRTELAAVSELLAPDEA